METLTVVAILAILAAIAIPSVAAMQRRLHMAELDAYARQIFLSAQKELTDMKASGRLDAFAGQLSGGERLEEAPADFPDTDNEAWKDLYAVSSGEPAAETFLLRANASLRDATKSGGAFLLEVNPLSGDVYSVFYAEQDFTYEDVRSLPSRERADRQERALGYYKSGTGEFGTVGLPDAFYPEIDVVNGEELFLTVRCDGLMSLRRTQRYLTLTVTLEDEHGYVHEETFQGGSGGMFIFNDEISVTLLLDSLDPVLAFSKQLPELTPGDDLRITAALVYEDQHSGIAITGAAEDRVNSLFGARNEAGDLEVSRVRHLNNLRKECYPVSKGGVTIRQTVDIDFDFARWDPASYHSSWQSSPLEAFAPIENQTLLQGSTVYGGGLTLRGFVIRGGAETGLFAAVEQGRLENLRLVDFRVSGRSRVGALAGYAEETEITGCGVYLSTAGPTGKFPADMEQRVGTCTVSGTSKVGGLVGETGSGCRVSGSFAAVGVSGRSKVGGLIGSASGTVEICYASGDVTASQTAGGLAGSGTKAEFLRCYATSGVTADSLAGGLVGNAAGCRVTDCTAYGEVLRPDGTADTDSSGGLVGRADGATAFTNCAYLTQAQYNNTFTPQQHVKAAGYTALKASKTDLTGESEPYALELRENRFPFRFLIWDGGAMTHYGNWPTEFQLQTSLVYYERYAAADANGSFYGYYAETSLTGGGASSGGWVVDTLRDETCVEDGYAILSIYALTEFDYVLDTGDDKVAVLSGTMRFDPKDPTATGPDRVALLEEKVSLEFTNENLEGGVSYVINNARVFQLPFQMQVTDRERADTFWETLTITGKLENGHIKVDGFRFYYCPDFAKNAVNPDFGGADGGAAPAEPKVLYVRSARQLNGLGRSYYYWNTTEKNRLVDVTFLQETDIDFGRYGAVDEDGGRSAQYCGEPFDLMDTSEENLYRNKPIGRTNNQNGKNFRNTYDGQGHRITDYRCETYRKDNYQFTGLFGEVQGGVLKNIVLDASDPENGSGYVISHYAGTKNHGGVGALAGLLYVKEAKEYESGCASVSNCAVSGYTVSYAPENPGAVQYSSAVGGLAGYCFGRIEHSSAVCRTVSSSSGKERFLGGIAGSLNGASSVNGCYAGQTVFAAIGKGKAHTGGVSGGFCNIFGVYQVNKKDSVDINAQYRKQQIKDCYSYCTWTDGTVYPIAPATDKFQMENCYYLQDTLHGASVGTTDQVTGRTMAQLAALSFEGSGRAESLDAHPWSAALRGQGYPFPAMVQNGERYVHYGDWPPMKSAEQSRLCYYERYADGGYGFYDLDRDGTPRSTLDTERDPDKDRTITAASYGILCPAGSGQSGTGKLFFAGAQALTTSADKETGGLALDGFLYDLYPLSGESLSAIGKDTPVAVRGADGGTFYVCARYGAAICAENRMGTAASPFQIRTAEQLQRATAACAYRQTHHIDASRAAGNLTNQAGTVYDGGDYTISGLESCLFTRNNGTLKNIRLTEADVKMSGNAAGLADSNVGAIVNCSVQGSVETTGAGTAAGALVCNNAGIIRGCYAKGTVRARYMAGGLVEYNSGTISGSYANCAVVASGEYGYAGGFIACADAGGKITDCYAAGSAEGTVSAAGFAAQNAGDVASSYSVASVSGDMWYGFADIGGSVSRCYWAGDTEYRGDRKEGDGEERTLAQIARLSLGTAWSSASAEESHPDSTGLSGQAYPYPKLTDMDHYGDWPVPQKSAPQGVIGAFRLYRQGNGSEKFYLHGCTVHPEDETVVEYGEDGKGRKAQNVYGVMFDGQFARDLASWRVYFQCGDDEKKELQLKKTTDYLSVTKDTGLIVNTFTMDGAAEVTITAVNSKIGKSYVFSYDEEDGTFEYDD